MKELKHSSLIILREFVLTCCKAEFAFFVSLLSFLPGIFTINKYSRGKVRLSLCILSTTSTSFTDT